MSLAFTSLRQYCTMIVRVSQQDLDELPIDGVFGNLDSLIIRLNSVPGITNVSEYQPQPETAVVGTLMQDGSNAYRIVLNWQPSLGIRVAITRIEMAWKEFSKSDNHVVESSKQAFYHDDGSFDYYVGAGA